MWAGGENVATFTGTFRTTAATSADNVQIGGISGAPGTLPWSGECAYFSAYDRSLSSSEIAEITANPNIIYEPHKMFVPEIAAVADTYNIQLLRHRILYQRRQPHPHILTW